MKKLILALILTIILPSIALGAFRFKDDGEIPTWAQDSIYTVREKGIMQGFPDGNFGARRNINRAQALVLLFRTQAVDFEDSQYFSKKFTDIPANTWFTKAVYKAIERGWITGFSDNTFRPEKELNRAEWATLIKRAFNLEPDPENLSTFIDVPADTWFTESIHAFHKNELIRYAHADNFKPEALVSRGEAAWTISEILGKPRLMGTSKTNDFSNNIQINSRDIAFKPKDFNPNLQSVESTRKELQITTNFDKEPRPVTLESDWTSLGNMRIKNQFDEKVTLNSLEFGLLFESSAVGPSREILLKITSPGFEKIQEFSRGNTSFIAGINVHLSGQEEKVFKVFIKPKEDPKFYVNSGNGTLSIRRAEALTTSLSTVDENDPNPSYDTILKQTPIKFITRNFTDIFFDPYPQP